MKVDKKETGKRIHDLRVSKNLSMEELAKIIHVSGKSTINEWEKGRTLPNKVSLKNIADFFQVTTDFILFGSLERYVAKIIESEVLDDAKTISRSSNLSLAVDEYLTNTTDFGPLFDNITTSDNEHAIEMVDSLELSYVSALIEKVMPDIIKQLKKDNVGYDDQKIKSISADIIHKHAVDRKSTIMGAIQTLRYEFEMFDDMSFISPELSLDEYMNSEDKFYDDYPKKKYDIFYRSKLNTLLREFSDQLGKLNESYLVNLEKYTGTTDPYKKY